MLRIWNFGKNSSIVADYRIFWDDLYMHQVMLNVWCKSLRSRGMRWKYLDDKLWSMRIRYWASRCGTSSTPRDMKVVSEEELPGLSKKNMSNRYYDIFLCLKWHFMYVMQLTEHWGFLQVVNCESPSWTRTEKSNVI